MAQLQRVKSPVPDNCISHTISAWLQTRTKHRPVVGVVCGSGLGGFSSILSDTQSFAYSDIPNFPRATVEGHGRELVFGTLHGVTVVCMRGRFHAYEGYSYATVALPIRVMAVLGVKALIVTNAAGGINAGFEVGEIMCITDHISLPGITGGGHPLIGPNDARFGPRFPNLNHTYDQGLRALALDAARALGLDAKLHANGTYCHVSGPSYETPAECRMLHMLGGDAVGMSTIPEVIAAAHCGLRVLGFSVIANKVVLPGTESARVAPTHEEVLTAVQSAEETMLRLVDELFKSLSDVDAVPSANASEAAPAVECDFRASAPRYVTRAELRRWQWLAGGALVALAAAQVAMFLRK